MLHVCCAGLLRACGNALTPKAAQAYLAGFQDVLPLETAELALLDGYNGILEGKYEIT